MYPITSDLYSIAFDQSLVMFSCVERNQQALVEVDIYPCDNLVICAISAENVKRQPREQEGKVEQQSTRVP